MADESISRSDLRGADRLGGCCRLGEFARVTAGDDCVGRMSPSVLLGPVRREPASRAGTSARYLVVLGRICWSRRSVLVVAPAAHGSGVVETVWCGTEVPARLGQSLESTLCRLVRLKWLRVGCFVARWIGMGGDQHRSGNEGFDFGEGSVVVMSPRKRLGDPSWKVGRFDPSIEFRFPDPVSTVAVFWRRCTIDRA